MTTLLRDALPNEALDYPSVTALLDCEVSEEHRGYDGKPWPGPHRHVWWWVVLANGKRVGWNENPSTGWSFPVLGKARK